MSLQLQSCTGDTGAPGMQGLLGSGVEKLLWIQSPQEGHGWLLCSATELRWVRGKATHKVQHSCGGQLSLLPSAWAALESCCHTHLQRLLGILGSPGWGPCHPTLASPGT